MITLTTDIGWEYAAQMKGIILSINPTIKIIDVSHSVEPQNIRQGAFVLYSTIPHFPHAIHIAVIDPGVGTKRRGIIIDCENGILIGPDNGLLIPAGQKLGIKEIYEISNINPNASNTFHGRDIFAPIAAKLSLGEKIKNFGKTIIDYAVLDFGTATKIDNKITGKIIFIDNFGNLITNIPKNLLNNEINFGDIIKLEINNKTYPLRFIKSYGYAKKGEVLATISSSDYFEISCNMGNASKLLKINVDDKVIIWLR